MSAKQKIISVKVVSEEQAAALTETLNLEADQGWRVQLCSTGVWKSNQVMREPVRAENHFIVLEESEARYQYFCISLSFQKYLVADLNTTLEEQSLNGYRLISLLQTYGFYLEDIQRHPVRLQHILIFEKKI